MTIGSTVVNPSKIASTSDASPSSASKLSQGLEVRGITRSFATQLAVDNVSFTVNPKEIVALVGASGSGKTTTLRMVAGYEAPDSGQIFLGGRDITSLPPERRGFGMVFQHYALFPHMSVLENVAFGLEARGVSKSERNTLSLNALEIVGLQTKSNRRVQQLSGGEQQRVALARAVVFEPTVLLLDEPLSNLDPTLRESTREELKNIIHRVGAPSLFVTHDQEDAFAIADKVVLLGKGKVLQIGDPEHLYRSPNSVEVARFIGRASLVPVENGKHLVLRPEDLKIYRADGINGEVAKYHGVVDSRRFAAGNYTYSVKSGDINLEVVSRERYELGDAVVVEVTAESPTVVAG